MEEPAFWLWAIGSISFGGGYLLCVVLPVLLSGRRRR